MTGAATFVALPAAFGTAGFFAVANVAQMPAARRQQARHLADPGASDAAHDASMWTWLAVVAVVAIVVISAVFLTTQLHGIARTTALAVAAGTSLGVFSVFAKATLRVFAAHGPRVFGSAAPGALVLAGVTGLLLAQSVFRAGPLVVSLLLIDIGEALVASLFAIVVFGERVGDLDLGALVGLRTGAVDIAAGVVVLDRSPLVRSAQAGIAAQPDEGIVTAKYGGRSGDQAVGVFAHPHGLVWPTRKTVRLEEATEESGR